MISVFILGMLSHKLDCTFNFYKIVEKDNFCSPGSLHLIWKLQPYYNVVHKVVTRLSQGCGICPTNR